MSYAGSERLSVQLEGHTRRYDARATFVRLAPDGKSDGDAHFVAEMLPDGSFEDRVDDDPNFLTILNQPFAVQLDRATLHDLRSMHGAIPFAAGSPLGGDTVLRGFLRPGPSGPVDGRATVAVRFEAHGPMTGSLPGRSDATISGTMHMDGTAYYALDDAMLLALTATLTVDARLQQSRGNAAVPVRITYRRSLRLAH
ncbi:MAG TPA: hypothetical protein VGX91_01780 [Candidatus Cybelea sp.]|nr:hypothetical protein [Candidatus Cybelea sp.]